MIMELCSLSPSHSVAKSMNRNSRLSKNVNNSPHALWRVHREVSIVKAHFVERDSPAPNCCSVKGIN